MPTFFTIPRNAATPCVERIEWLTDVQIARDGTELRRRIREMPRYTYSFDVLASNPGTTAILDSLRTETEFKVPAWCHAFESGDFPDALEVWNFIALDQRTGAYVKQTPFEPVDWSTHTLCAPYVTARYASDSRQRTYVNGRLHSASVAFVCNDLQYGEDAYFSARWSTWADAFYETRPELCAADDPSIPLLDYFTRTASEITESIDMDANYFDSGASDLWKLRFIKRSKSVRLTISGRANVIAFRWMMFFLMGRRNTLRWTAPGDAAERTWRLASDAVELKYLRPNLCTVNLQLVEVAA